MVRPEAYWLDQSEQIEILKILTRFRLYEMAIKKFPELQGKTFSDDDVFDLITIGLYNGYSKRISK